MPPFVIDLIQSLRTEAGLVAAVIAVVEASKQIPAMARWLSGSDDRKALLATILTYALGIGAYAASVQLGLEADGSLGSILALLTLLAAVAQIVYGRVLQPLRKFVRREA